MKKIFVLFSLSLLFLFSSCSLMFFQEEKQHYINIKLPGIAKTERSILERGYTADELQSNTFHFYITLICDNPSIKPVKGEGSSGQTVRLSVRPGNWMATCEVTLEGSKDVIAYYETDEVISISLNQEQPPVVILKPTQNTTEQIESFELISGPTIKNYKLGDKVDLHGCVILVKLNNGYSIPYDYEDINQVFGKAAWALYDNNGNFSTNLNGDLIAERNMFYIGFYPNLGMFTEMITREYKDNEYDIYIGPKEPVITKHPVSTIFSNKNEDFTFSVEVDNFDSSLYGEISYEWNSLYGSIPLTQGNTSWHTATYTDTGSLNSMASENDNRIKTSDVWCVVTNTDSEGLNNPGSVSVTSNRAVLQQWYPGSAGATNQNYVITDTKVVFDTSKEFFVDDLSGKVPDATYFKVVKTYLPLSHYLDGFYDIEIKEVAYTDYDIQIENVATEQPCIGYVPYKVKYSYEKYIPTSVKGDSIASYKTVPETINEETIVYVPTKLKGIPDFNVDLQANVSFGIYSSSEVGPILFRYYNTADSKWYTYFNGEYVDFNSSFAETIAPYSINLSFNYYENDENHTLQTIYPFNNAKCDVYFTEETESSNTTRRKVSLSDRNPDDKNKSNFSYELDSEDKNFILNDGRLYIYLEIEKSLKKDYESWFVDQKPVTSQSQRVSFQLKK